MTDEEREDYEALVKAHDTQVLIAKQFQKLFREVEPEMERLLKEIDAERARSAKLIEALKGYADYRDECDVAARAIFEYEAGRD